MHIFLLTIIPLVYFVNEYLCHDQRNNGEQMFCIFSGFVIACIYALIDFFAVGLNHLWINKVSSVWAYYLISQTLIPVVVCAVPVMLAKDSLRKKIQYLFTVLASFYAIFLPSKIMTGETGPDAFLLICYPLMMAAFIFDIDTAAGVFGEDIDVGSFLWLRCVVAGFAVVTGLLLPSLFAALWFLNRLDAGIWVLIVFFLLSSVGLRIIAGMFLKKS